MQGQKGAIGSLPESLVLEHGSTSGDAGVLEQQLCWTNFLQNPAANANQEARNVRMWSMGESSSSTANNGHYHYGHNVTVNPSTFVGVKPSSYASSSSSTVETEAQPLPCKRKADQLNVGQSSSGIESSNILQRSEGSNSLQQSVLENPTPSNTMPFNPIIPRLGSGTRISSDNLALENIRRNVRIRIDSSHQQDQLPASNNNISNTELLNFSAMCPSLGLNPVATTGDSSSRREGQPMLQVPGLRTNLHSASRSRSSSSRANWPVGSGDYLRTTPTNISDHSLFVQPHDIRNTAQAATNLDLNSTNGPTFLSSTSNPMTNLDPRRGSSLYPSRRQTELLRRALLSSSDPRAGGDGWQTSNLFSRVPPPVGASASFSQESGTPPVIAITGHRPHNHLQRLRTSDRQLDGAFGLTYLSRRGRLVSEMRNVLDRIRRGEGLRFEDVMILDQSVFYGMADIFDRHRDMRLDIDNMSYEELLALEERIGNVNTGLTEESIYKHLKQKTYASVAGQSDDEPCCICQEEYKNGDDLGALYCGHDFHTSCIKQWLLQKNSCPVCKSAASK